MIVIRVMYGDLDLHVWGALPCLGLISLLNCTNAQCATDIEKAQVLEFYRRSDKQAWRSVVHHMKSQSLRVFYRLSYIVHQLIDGTTTTYHTGEYTLKACA